MASAGGPSVRRSWVLLTGAVLGGTFAAAAMWLAGRALGLVAFEALAQLWTLWGLVAVGVTFAFQQWEISRNLGLAASRRLRVPPDVRLGLLVAGIVVLVPAAVFRVPVFGSVSWTWPLAAASLPVGTAVTGMAYATFARAGRLRGLALLIAAENGVRLLVTGVLASFGAPTVVFAVTVPAGFLVSLLPLVVTPTARPSAPQVTGVAVRHLPALAMIGSATNLLVFGGPLLLGAAGGQAAVVSSLFLVLIIPRVPMVLVNALVPAIIVAGAASVGAGDAARVRRWVVLLSASGGGLAVLVGPLAYAVADPIAEALFQAGGQFEPAAYGLLAVAVVLVLTATVTNPLLIALNRLKAVATAWAMVVISGAALTAFGTLAEPVLLATWMSICAAAVVAAHLAVALTTRPIPRTSRAPYTEEEVPGPS